MLTDGEKVGGDEGHHAYGGDGRRPLRALKQRGHFGEAEEDTVDRGADEQRHDAGLGAVIEIDGRPVEGEELELGHHSDKEQEQNQAAAGDHGAGQPAGHVVEIQGAGELVEEADGEQDEDGRGGAEGHIFEAGLETALLAPKGDDSVGADPGDLEEDKGVEEIAGHDQPEGAHHQQYLDHGAAYIAFFLVLLEIKSCAEGGQEGEGAEARLERAETQVDTQGRQPAAGDDLHRGGACGKAQHPVAAEDETRDESRQMNNAGRGPAEAVDDRQEEGDAQWDDDQEDGVYHLSLPKWFTSREPEVA